MDRKYCDELLGDRTELKLKRAWMLKREGKNDIAVYLFNDALVTYHADGRITLNSGGYRTAGRRKAMNMYLPDDWQIVGSDPDWLVTYVPTGTPVPFNDGMTIGEAPKLRSVPNLRLRGSQATKEGFFIPAEDVRKLTQQLWGLMETLDELQRRQVSDTMTELSRIHGKGNI